MMWWDEQVPNWLVWVATIGLTWVLASLVLTLGWMRWQQYLRGDFD
jgi:hypothetical protein